MMAFGILQGGQAGEQLLAGSICAAVYLRCAGASSARLCLKSYEADRVRSNAIAMYVIAAVRQVLMECLTDKLMLSMV